MEDIEEAEIKVIVGPQKKSRVIKRNQRATAYHDGRSAIRVICFRSDEVLQVSIIHAEWRLDIPISLPGDKYSFLWQEIDRTDRYAPGYVTLKSSYSRTFRASF